MKKFNGKILAIILIIVGVATLLGVALGIGLSGKPNDNSDSKTQSEKEWTNNY